MSKKMIYAISSKVRPAELGSWRFTGHVGSYLDRIAAERLIGSHARECLYPVTEETFRQREDDAAAPQYGEWRGEFWGKWILSAIAACRYYHSDDLKEFIADAVDGLITTQDDNGYIGTYKDSSFFTQHTWNIWCRKYTLWGLLEAWELLGKQKILDAAIKFCDHLLTEVGPGQHELCLTGEFCGLPSSSIIGPVCKLYRATGNSLYLEFAEYIVEQWRQHPSGLPDIVTNGLHNRPIHEWGDNPDAWAKSYELISCVEGLLELYRITGNNDYLQTGINIHTQIAEWEESPVGSVSFNDKFIGSRFLKNVVAEICDAVYWNRLSFSLLTLTGNPAYLEHIETTLYNSLLCAFNAAGNWGLRRLRFSHEHLPAPYHFLPEHHCCIDNLPRGLFQAIEAAVMIADDTIYIGLYCQGKGIITLDSGIKTELVLNGELVDDGKMTLTVTPEKDEEFELCLRIPAWSKKTVVRINGEAEKVAEPRSWLRLKRTWHRGDRIDIQFDVGLRKIFFDNEKIAKDDPRIGWHEELWLKMQTIEEGNPDRSKMKMTNLIPADLASHTPAQLFKRGPLVLARDVRLGDDDIFAVVPRDIDGILTVEPSVDGIWKVFSLTDKAGKRIKLCDFASAGNSYDNKSKFNTWLDC